MVGGIGWLSAALFITSQGPSEIACATRGANDAVARGGRRYIFGLWTSPRDTVV